MNVCQLGEKNGNYEVLTVAMVYAAAILVTVIIIKIVFKLKVMSLPDVCQWMETRTASYNSRIYHCIGLHPENLI